MLINKKQLKKISVETQSGQYLGQISDWEMETTNCNIEKFSVKSGPLASVFSAQLIISKDQIIDLTDEKMIVEDAVIKATAKAKTITNPIEKLETTEPIITSDNS